MNRITCWALLTFLGLIITPACAQGTFEDEDASLARPAEKAEEGIWFTQRQMELFVHRIVDDMAERYEFDEDQLYLTRDALKERLIPFLTENRRDIQPLLNQFIEAQMEDEPPAVDDVAGWAGRALPLMHKFEDVVDDFTGDMREYLTDDQIVIMEGEQAAFRAGWGMIANKVAVWSEGGFDAQTEWRRSPDHRERKREERRKAQEAMQEAREQAVAEAEGEQSSAAAGKTRKDAWARYVDEFVQKYQFTPEQSERAYRTLDKITERRDNYLKRKLADMERIEKTLDEAETDPEKRKAKAELEKLNAPVERMFQQLKDELQKLPTRAQRRAATKAAREKTERQATPVEEAPASQPASAQPGR